MKTVEKLLNLMIEEKESGIYLSNKGKIIIGHYNMPKNFTGEYKSWWDNEQLYLHRYYKNGELHGKYKQWHDNGQLWSFCYYKNGKLNGELKEWNYDGKLLYHHYYENGKIVKDYLK